MLSDDEKVQIRLFCHEIAGDVLTCILNPKYSHLDINFEEFVEKVTSGCRDSVVRCIRLPESTHQSAKQYAEEQARYLTSLWVGNMTK